MTIDVVLTTELTGIENAWWRALRDRDWAVARGYMRDDFSITTAGWIDAPLGADAWLASLAARYQLDDARDEHRRVVVQVIHPGHRDAPRHRSVRSLQERHRARARGHESLVLPVEEQGDAGRIDAGRTAHAFSGSRIGWAQASSRGQMPQVSRCARQDRE